MPFFIVSYQEAGGEMCRHHIGMSIVVYFDHLIVYICICVLKWRGTGQVKGWRSLSKKKQKKTEC